MTDRDPPQRRRPRWADLSLRAKGIVVVAMPVLATLIAVGAFSLSTERARLVEEQAARSSHERFVARSLPIALLDAEAAVRGHLLTGREEFLDPYAEAVASATLQL